MKKSKRFKYDITKAIENLEFDKAKDICSFNGYKLSNEEVDGFGCYHIAYELENNKIKRAFIR